MAGVLSAGKPSVAKPAGRSRIYLLGLVCGIVATMATPTAALAAALLLPGGFAWFTEQAPTKPLGRTMLLFGLAVGLPYLADLWRGSGSLETALAMALDPHDIAETWAAQAAGWLLAEGLPIIGLLVIDAGNARKARQLRAERAKIAEEWALPAEP